MQLLYTVTQDMYVAVQYVLKSFFEQELDAPFVELQLKMLFDSTPFRDIRKPPFQEVSLHGWIN